MFWGRYDCQRTLAIRIAAITLASDSAITLARFRPSKMERESVTSMLRQGQERAKGEMREGLLQDRRE